ncbi:MAG: ATP-binding protein [Endomicrobiia bacterium]
MSSIFFIATNQYIKKQNQQIFIEQLSINKDIVLKEVIPLLKKKNIKELTIFVNVLSKTMQRRITIININGKVIADSDKNILEMQNHLNRSEIKNALTGKTAHDIRYSSTLNQEMLYIACPIEINSQIVAILRLSMPLSTINIFSQEMRKNILIIILIACFIALFLSYFFTKKISNKITKLKNASDKMAKGDFKIKILTKSEDELDKLAESFNFMSEKIEQLFSQTKEQNDKLDKILSSIDDTIILLDKSGKILLHNNAFNKHFKNINPDNKYYWEVFRAEQIDLSINDLIKKKNITISKEIKEEEKYFLFTACSVLTSDNIVLTFHNITSMKQMELIKREFVANASHELKTPLTAINGFVETIETETDIESIKHYIEIIKKHSLRLSRIVTDLLSLSEMEHNRNIELIPLQLEEIISNTMNLFTNKLNAKNLSFNFIKKDGEKYTILANEFYIEQMLINLIENAIKYTEEGQITIKLDKDKDKVILEIADTGIGIAEEHLSRIFERFYVVDKARSRKTGGTGLGLAIVKYIVNNHNAIIEVSSKQNIGTTFTIRF